MHFPWKELYPDLQVHTLLIEIALGSVQLTVDVEITQFDPSNRYPAAHCWQRLLMLM